MILILVFTVILGKMYFSNLITLGDLTMLFTLAYRIDDSLKELINSVEQIVGDYQVSAIAAQNLLVEIDNLDKVNAKHMPVY